MKKLLKKKLKADSDFCNFVKHNSKKDSKYSYSFDEGDLYYAIQKFSYVVKSNKKSGKKRKIKIKASDCYDFDNIRLPLTAFSNAANNLGWVLQNLNVIYPYVWKVTLEIQV